MKPTMTQRINKVSESPSLAAVSRWTVTFGTPLLAGLMIWVGSTTAENNTAISVLTEKVQENAALQAANKAAMQSQYDKFEAWAMRTFGDHEDRIRKIEQRR